MARRSISDPEIALIRAMHGRGMANKDIQFLFNRPERPVNSGRVTDIAQGRYGPEVPAARDEEVDEFVAVHSPASPVGAISIPIARTGDLRARDPLDPINIRSLFAPDEYGIWRLTVGETDEHECKSNFGLRHRADWMRAIAALANNRGGYIFFGVLDKDGTGEGADNHSYRVAGLPNDAFQKADPAQIATLVKDALDPTPRIRIDVIKIGGQVVGVIFVEQHPARPVIVRATDSGGLREGDIFYRYPGRSDRIKYSDLRAILDERDLTARRDVLPLVEKLIELGPKHALVADLKSGLLEGSGRQVVIDPALIEQITFIREGEFSEKLGAPTLRLIGNVTTLDGKSIDSHVVRRNVTPDAVLRNFLNKVEIVEPLQYLAYLAHSPRSWLPIWYYVNASERSVEEIINILESETASYKISRDCAVERLLGKKSAFKFTPGKPASILSEFREGRVFSPGGGKDDIAFALAVQGLSDRQVDFSKILSVLEECFDRAQGDDSRSALLRSAIFRAACRLDELLFGPTRAAEIPS